MNHTRAGVVVRRATHDDAGPLVSVLAEAFLDGPVADWLVPDPAVRRVVFHRYFQVVLRHGLDHGHVDTTHDLSAVAIWHPCTEPPRGVDPEHQAAVEKATGVYARKFQVLDAMFEAWHPRQPHHYLTHVAVDPPRQNHGIGAALLTSYHWQLDRLGLPAYLEATNHRNRHLYTRLGYQTGPPLILPTEGPTIWRMWRQRPTGAVTSRFPADAPPDPRTL
ncbi:GNAT family N-acetyltransferase [Micromonospora haikouensis]|uniref:GNAT family N-acetyltransferase n=1 Tax=Micromonospora haikouensis TaxID=686309 RepID=UPI0036B6935A